MRHDHFVPQLSEPSANPGRIAFHALLQLYLAGFIQHAVLVYTTTVNIWKTDYVKKCN